MLDVRAIKNILNKYFDIIDDGKYPITIIGDGKVKIDGGIRIKDYSTRFEKLPVVFDWIKGYADFSSLDLKTLQGSPDFVGNNFYCGKNKLTSLEYGPIIVIGNYYCHGNNFKSLEGLPLQTNRFMIQWQPYTPLLRLVTVPYKVEIHLNNIVNDIITKYQGKPSRSNIIACQKDLIDAGFEGNAAW